MKSIEKVFIGMLVLLACGFSYAEEKAHELATEVKAEVPALEKMHEVIYPMWHVAWANKDMEMFGKLLPDIEKNADAVAKSELPGILRDKKVKWEKGVQAMQETVIEYKKALNSKTDQAILDAAEKLHRNYEMLVRIVTPVLKEMESFHEALYPLYHYHIVKFDQLKVQSDVAELQKQMDLLNKVVLPERMKKRNDSFIAARATLSTSVEELAKTIPSKDEKKIKEAVETMHTAYLGLEKVFE